MQHAIALMSANVKTTVPANQESANALPVPMLHHQDAKNVETIAPAVTHAPADWNANARTAVFIATAKMDARVEVVLIVDALLASALAKAALKY